MIFSFKSFLLIFFSYFTPISELKTETVLDDRHSKRGVKCVVWKPRNGPTVKKVENFALKIIIRGERDVHSKRVFNEKDIMLALDSPWHTKLINT